MLEYVFTWKMYVSYSVSYFLLKVFIGFVLKQFEYIEVGQFRQVLIPFNNVAEHFHVISKDSANVH